MALPRELLYQLRLILDTGGSRDRPIEQQDPGYIRVAARVAI